MDFCGNSVLINVMIKVMISISVIDNLDIQRHHHHHRQIPCNQAGFVHWGELNFEVGITCVPTKLRGPQRGAANSLSELVSANPFVR